MSPFQFAPRIAALCALSCLPLAASAVVTINFQQVGLNVVATGSGSANVTALTRDTSSTGAQVWPVSVFPETFLSIGPVSTPDLPIAVSAFIGISGPTNIGTGTTNAFASSGSGDRIGLVANRVMYLPFTYVSGAAVSGTSTWNNASFASLGLTPGTYTWTWGSGATADSMVINIGTPVPEPGTLALMLAGAGLLGALARRRMPAARQG